VHEEFFSFQQYIDYSVCAHNDVMKEIIGGRIAQVCYDLKYTDNIKDGVTCARGQEFLVYIVDNRVPLREGEKDIPSAATLVFHDITGFQDGILNFAVLDLDYTHKCAFPPV